MNSDKLSLAIRIKIILAKLHIKYVKIKAQINCYLQLPSLLLEMHQRINKLSDEIQAFSDLIMNEKLDVFYMNNPDELKKFLEQKKN